MVQFADGPRKVLSSGYCLDDNARALLVAVAALGIDRGDGDAAFVCRESMRFVVGSQKSDGSFHNVMDESGAFIDDEGSADSIGRAVWACGIAARSAPDPAVRIAARNALEKAVPRLERMEELKPKTYAVLGLSAAVGAPGASPVPPVADALGEPFVESLTRLARSLNDEFSAAATDDWPWWEPILSWGNARPPEALLRAAIALDEPSFARSGRRALEFLASVTQPDEMLVPIGNRGWYSRAGARAIYDQQPIEACGMVDAWLAAESLTGDAVYRARAIEAFEWFFGRNTGSAMIAQASIGGCRDGLQSDSVNANMGAESTLSYLQAHLSIAHACAGETRLRPAQKKDGLV